MGRISRRGPRTGNSITPGPEQGVSTRSLVLMMPALQARALTQERDYVTAEDVEYLSPVIFAHRLELAPGAGAAEDVIAECASEPLERLARASLKR